VERFEFTSFVTVIKATQSVKFPVIWRHVYRLIVTDPYEELAASRRVTLCEQHCSKGSSLPERSVNIYHPAWRHGREHSNYFEHRI